MTELESSHEFGTDYQNQMEAAQGSWWVRSMHEFGRRLLGGIPRSVSVLDAGCGSGATLHWLAPLVDESVGLDVSLPGLARARRAAPLGHYLAASASSLPFTGARFDLVVSTDVLQHLQIPDRQLAISETYRVLRPGGRVLLRTNARSLRRGVSERDDWHLIDPRALRREVEAAGFVVERMTHANAIGAIVAVLGNLRHRTGGQRLAHHQHSDVADPEFSNTGVGQGASTMGIGIPTRRSAWVERCGSLAAAIERFLVFRLGVNLPVGHTLYVLASRQRA